MKVLLLNGSPHQQGCTAVALAEIAKTLDACGVESETLWIGKEPLRGCIACGGCREKAVASLTATRQTCSSKK